MLFFLHLAIALALPPASGWLWLRLLAGRAVVLDCLEQASVAWCVGWGTVTVAMLALGLSGLSATPWRPLPLFGIWLASAVVALLLLVWQRTRSSDGARGTILSACGPKNGTEGMPDAASHLRERGANLMTSEGLHRGKRIDLWRAAGAVVALQCAIVSIHMVAWPVSGWDGWSIWALKARIFYLSQSIPSGYFHDASRLFSHPDYPLLLPLAETWIDGWLGQANSWAIMALFPFFFLGIVVLVMGTLRRSLGPRPALAGAMALLCVPFVIAQGGAGDADIPVTLMMTGSSIFLWQWLYRPDNPRALILSGLFAGLAAWTKKEGLILLLITMLVVVIAAWQRRADAPGCRRAPLEVCLFLAPALLLVGPWLAFLAVRRPLSRDFLPFDVETLVVHLNRLPTILALVTQHLVDVWRWNVIWLSLGAMIVLKRRHLRRGGPMPYLLLLLGLQVACDGVLFVFSDWQPYTDHLEGALDRLLLHTLPLAVMLLISLIVSEERAVVANVS
jgi:hypothetical protein